MSRTHVLANRTVISTRPEATADGELEAALKAMGAQVLALPMLELHPLTFNCPSPPDFTWLFFTSRQAVHAFWGQTATAGFHGLPIACVGPATAKALTRYGLQARFVSPQFDARSAATAFTQTCAGQGGKILWPCGNLASPELRQILEAAGMTVTPLTVYETEIRTEFPLGALHLLQKPVDLVIFTSPSAVQGFHQAWRQAELGPRNYYMACLGPKTGQEAERLLGPVEIQAHPASFAGLTEAIRRYYENRPC